MDQYIRALSLRIDRAAQRRDTAMLRSIFDEAHGARVASTLLGATDYATELDRVADRALAAWRAETTTEEGEA